MHPYAGLARRVAKPARYLGGEPLSVHKRPEDVDARVVLAFPDVYEIGMSHLGTKILYSALNAHPRIAAERAFAPWTDMEALLRERAQPLVSLESSTPLGDFDVIGISLQYELTFTNALTLLDLGGLPLRAAERGPGDPLVLGGGPTATHPEPMAPFFDAFFVGEAERELPELVLAWAAMRREGRARLDALADLAARFPVYVPALYETEVDALTGMVVVGTPRDRRAPARVTRAVVAELDEFPFPTDSPVPFAEAVFDRAAIEIARGCTEGCRFCQAGMIYRPVRERSPASIVDSVLEGIARGGYDEVSLTSLSTADYSCVAPLVGRVMEELRARKVSLSVSSLRAYGLDDAILDELARLRISGLTLAPEAGTQRMRDVINKNISDEHVEDSAHRLFARGFNKLKLYFMIGLPSERDEDVRAIADLGRRTLGQGRRLVGRRAQVTVSVSSHVPKPHTPFQWFAQDAPEEIRRKQALLAAAVGRGALRLKCHNWRVTFLEGVLARGDRCLADAIEGAWRGGARFDGWDEELDLETWERAFADAGVEPYRYLAARPEDARLPWDHIDVGVDRAFLVKEHRKAGKERVSPPCGKTAGRLVHPSSVAEAEADERPLVCYQCGVACDLDAMRAGRIDALRSLGALEPRARISEAGAESAEERPPRRRPGSSFPDRPHTMYRVRYTKLGRAAYLGHLDTARALARAFRRAGLTLAYTHGFHPKPRMQFTPPLALGAQGLAEYADVGFEGEWDADELRDRLRTASPPGNRITGVWTLPEHSPSLGKLVTAYDLLLLPPAHPRRTERSAVEVAVADLLGRERIEVHRKGKRVDLRPLIAEMRAVPASAAREACDLLGWSPDFVDPADDEAALVWARIGCTPDGSAKPQEIAEALGILGPGGEDPGVCWLARLGFQGVEEAGGARPDLARVAPVATLSGEYLKHIGLESFSEVGGQ